VPVNPGADQDGERVSGNLARIHRLMTARNAR